MYSLSHHSTRGSRITDLEFTNPFPILLEHMLHQQQSSKPFVCAMQSTHEMIPHRLYAFVQGRVLDPWTPINLIPFYWNLGLSTVNPSSFKNNAVLTSSSNIISSSSSFLPHVQLSVSMDKTLNTSSSAAFVPWRNTSFEPVLQFNIQKTFHLSSKTEQNVDFYSTQFQLRLSPTRGLFDLSTLFSKTVSIFGPSNVSPYSTLKQGGLTCTFGLRSIRKESIHWLLRLDHEDLSIHIPIEFKFISPSMMDSSNIVTSFCSGKNLFLVFIESMYLWFLSHCIQSALHNWIQRGRVYYQWKTIRK